MHSALGRGIALATALSLALSVSPALAGKTSTPFSASFDRGGTIAFKVVKKRGKPRKVRRIKINDIVANCENSAAELDYRIRGKARILDDRTFAVRSESPTGAEAMVRAKLSRTFKRADGTARVYGEFAFDEGTKTCDSGRQDFDARASAARGLGQRSSTPRPLRPT